MPRIAKDCFGTVISTLTKMKECVRCEFLSECRSINWSSVEEGAGPVVIRRPDPDALKEGDMTDIADRSGTDAPA